MSMENSDSLLEEIGAQALSTAAYQPPEAVSQAVDAVTPDQVVKVRALAPEGMMLHLSSEPSPGVC